MTGLLLFEVNEILVTFYLLKPLYTLRGFHRFSSSHLITVKHSTHVRKPIIISSFTDLTVFTCELDSNGDLFTSTSQLTQPRRKTQNSVIGHRPVGTVL